MKKIIKNTLLIIFLILIISPNFVFGIDVSGVRTGMQNSAGALATTENVPTIATNLVAYLLGFIGIIIFIIIIISGFQWITAGGNEETVTKSKNNIKNAIMGLLVILIAYILVTTLFTILKDVV